MKTYINKTTKDIYEYEDDYIVKDKNLQKITLQLDKNGNRYQKYTKTIKNGILLADIKELQIQKLNQDILNLEMSRKKEQYKDIVHNTHTLKASQLARDNLFKAYILQKEDNQKSILWLNSSDESINLSIEDIKNILLNLKKRDEKLYFKEAQEKLNIQSQIKNLKTSGE